jgi:hypothetical protein
MFFSINILEEFSWHKSNLRISQQYGVEHSRTKNKPQTTTQKLSFSLVENFLKTQVSEKGFKFFI